MILTREGDAAQGARPIAGAASVTLPDRRDWLLIGGLAMALGLYAARYLDFSQHPSEDAAILMRYAQNLADGHGVVWNVGERPVDGATDFLFMVVVAGLAKVGLSVEAAVRSVGLVSHFVTAIVIYLGIRAVHGSARWMALLSAAFFGIGPGLRYVVAYFGTPFFALFCAIAWWLATRIVRDRDETHATALTFALAGLVMGLIRPEGVLLAGFMLLSVLYGRGPRQSKWTLVYFVAVFALIGGGYFLWRWQYFGYPLPNPFYRKGGWLLYSGSLDSSIRNVIALCLPFLVVFPLGLGLRATRRQVIFVLIPVVGFAAIWLLLSDAMNFMRRFQYAILPIVLMAWPPVLAEIVKRWCDAEGATSKLEARVVAVAQIVAMAVVVLGYQHVITARDREYRDGKYDVAVMLGEYAGKGYTIATSEAGLLPFYSRWRSVDTWGLNDQWITHNRGITEAYLDRYRPEVIMVHTPSSPLVPLSGSGAWFDMVQAITRYVQRNSYVLAAVYGETPYDTHYYYVKRDFSAAAVIVNRIRAMDYRWSASGQRSINYASLRMAEE